MSNVSAIVFHQPGVPHEVARLEKIELPLLGAEEARVRLLAAPINPADLNVLEGKYPTSPMLPGVPGVEGVGIVEKVGGAVRQVKAGDRVLFPHGLGTWREAGNVEAASLVIVPPAIPIAQAAMLRVNPATALRMLRDFVPLEPSDWVLQNAANSGVGRSVMQIARACGWRTINIVRRAELIEERWPEADVVLLESEDLPEQIAQATGGAPIHLALNGVGGESAVRQANALAPGGTLVTYGAMSRKPLKIPNGLLIFRDLRWRGFWVSHWYRESSPEARAAMFEELFALAQSGALHTPVERIYPLAEASAALQHAAQSARTGKILFGSPEVVAEPQR